jgi:hypothetical protein
VPRRRAHALALLLTAAALAGCGGGSAAHGPTRAGYIAKADAICRSAHAQTNQLISKIKALAPALLIGGTAAAPSAPGLVAQLHTVAAADLARLRALAQPSADRAAIAKFLDPLASIVSAMGKALADLRAGHAVDAAARFSNAIPTAQAVRSAAVAYGFKDCPSLLAALS